MDNITNLDGCVGQLSSIKEEQIVDDPINIKQREEDIKHLHAEINFKSRQLEDKLKLLYSMEKTKETYDKIASISSLQNN